MNKLCFPCLLALAAAVTMPASAQAADNPIAPFVSPQTNAVVRLDLTQVDMDAVNAFVQKQVEASTPTPDANPAAAESAARDKKDMQTDLAKAKKWVADFQAAGGKDIYLIVELSGMFQGAPGEMVVPLDNAANPDALAKLFNPNPPPANGGPPQPMQTTTAVIGKTLVFSTGATLQKLKSAPPAAPTGHIDLVDALASDTSGAALQIAGSPASIKNNPMLGMMMSGMTGMHSSGGPNGQPQPPLSEPEWGNVSWVLLSITSPPKESGQFVCQCKDADSAAALSKLLTTKMQQGFDAHNKDKDMDMDPADRAKLKAALTPVVNGSQVKIAMDQNTLDNVFMPIMDKSRQKAMARTKSQPPFQQQPMPGNDGMPPDNGGGTGGGSGGGGL